MYLIILLTTVPMVGNNIIRVSGLTKRFSEKRMRKSVEFKRKVVFAVTKDKRTVASVAHEFGIARKTVYQWLKRLDGARGRAKSTALDNHYIKGNRHPRAYRFAHRHKLLRLITSDPELSITNLARRLRIGRHATVASLQELKLSTRLERENFARLYNGPGRLHLDIKGQIVRAVLDEGKSIAEVAREFKVARKTIHVWIKRYQADKRLSEKYVVGLAHPKALSPDMRNKILAAVIKNPQASIHKLARNLSISSHGVWNILKIHNLTHAPARLAFAQKEMQDFTLPNLLKTDRVRSVWETFTPNLAPAPPPSSIEQFSSTSPQNLPPISTLNLLKLIIKASISTFISLLKLPSQLPRWWMSFLAAFIIPVIISGVLLSGVNYLSLILQAPTVTVGIGYLFASLALSFGLFFFLYSSKYYLSALLVLRFSRKIITQDETNAATKSLTSNHQQSGLVSDVSQIELTRHPFVSIHLPLYNEKRVVNRLLEAVTSLDYPNYEVIVCDDSTDETKDIVLEWQNHPRVKISHRENRQGYKGGALKQALNLMDPATEFVLVFDADFLPYPDTITQFLKYFQVTSKAGHPRPRIEYGAGSDRGSPSESIPIEIDSRFPPEADRRGNDNFNYADSNIAAIQGYQWHVLNKSENWVTRGVRSEYAGSYVIERSGNEIYGGLKQIAGSVFMIRADLLKLPEYQWGTSITEDFELTLKLYRDGYKVVYTPYIQAPSECVSTLKRLVRQRMRWAEGHSHNIRKHFVEMLFGRWVEAIDSPASLRETNAVSDEAISKIAASDSLPAGRQARNDDNTFLPSRLTTIEKLEFLYLAPYYLQSFFFLLGTLAWFISEAVLKVRLPFWTQVWGWSLVLTNLLSLPLMNTVGMFLEEAEEKDYGGILSFIALTYILTPFQAYAAVKGFLEKSEGPWFRTPKTGHITDTFKRGRFYRWLSSWLPGFSGTGQLNKPIFVLNYVFAKSVTSQKQPARRRGRLRLRSKAVLSLFILLAMVLNYLSFFTPPPARAVSPAFEQQINIMNKNNSTTSTTDTPTDNSLGLVHWDGTKYTGATVYFEAILQTNNAGSTATATLYDSAGNSVSGSSVSVLGTAWARARSAAITLTNNTDYTVRFKTSANTANFRTARLIILQSDATRITDTVTQVELGINSTTTSTSYIFAAAKKKLFGYNSTVWTPTPTIYFEATLANNTAGQTALAALYERASTCATVVSGSEVTVTGTTWALVRSSAITLTSGTDYMICVKAGANTAQIANAKIILEQTDAAGITNVELYHMYASIDVQTTSTTFVRGTFMNEFNPSNFTGGTFTYFSEATLRVTTSGPTATADLYNTTDAVAITGSTVTETTTQMTRDRSADITANMPASAKDLEGELKTDSGTAQVADSHLVIQVSSLTVPEKTLIFFPLALFLPFLIKRRKSLRVA